MSVPGDEGKTIVNASYRPKGELAAEKRHPSSGGCFDILSPWKPPSPFASPELSGMDRNRRLSGGSFRSRDAGEAAELPFSMALEMRKRLDLPEEQLVRWARSRGDAP